MTQAEYARHARISRQAVGKMVKAEKIQLDDDGKIDPAAADFARGQHQFRVNTPDDDDDVPSLSPRRPADVPHLTQARTAELVYKAKIAKLEYEKRVGEVIPVAGLVEAANACAEKVLQAIKRISASAEQLTAGARDGVSGVRAAAKVIETEMRAEIADAFMRMAQDAMNNGAAVVEAETVSLDS